MKYQHVDLFSGIGGFALGLRPWVDTVMFCENEPAAQRVLAHLWPGVPIFTDIRELAGDDIRTVLKMRRSGDERKGLPRVSGSDMGDGTRDRRIRPAVSDVADADQVRQPQPQGRKRNERRRAGDGGVILTAGFPCQDISHAGRLAGITGERSGLWSELARILGELRPDVALLENVAGLLSGRDVVDGASGPMELSWLGTVLGDLAEIGYDCEWHCIPAAAVGAPHRRDRWWCVAYPASVSDSRSSDYGGGGEHQKPTREFRGKGLRQMGHANDPRPQGHGRLLERAGERAAGPGGRAVEGAGQSQPYMGLLADGLSERLAGLPRWPDDPHPATPRVAQGVKNRKAKLQGLGNAIVPQVAAVIGAALFE